MTDRTDKPVAIIGQLKPEPIQNPVEAPNSISKPTSLPGNKRVSLTGKEFINGTKDREEHKEGPSSSPEIKDKKKLGAKADALNNSLELKTKEKEVAKPEKPAATTKAKGQPAPTGSAPSKRSTPKKGKAEKGASGRRGSASRDKSFIPDHYKTEICRTHRSLGYCEYEENCQFAHGVEELRPRRYGVKYKTQLCKNYHLDGHCRFGSRCKFIHDEKRIQVGDREFWLISPSENLVRVEVVENAQRAAQLSALIETEKQRTETQGTTTTTSSSTLSSLSPQQSVPSVHLPNTMNSTVSPPVASTSPPPYFPPQTVHVPPTYYTAAPLPGVDPPPSPSPASSGSATPGMIYSPQTAHSQLAYYPYHYASPFVGIPYSIDFHLQNMSLMEQPHLLSQPATPLSITPETVGRSLPLIHPLSPPI